jgi:hypothetical protein
MTTRVREVRFFETPRVRVNAEFRGRSVKEAARVRIPSVLHT